MKALLVIGIHREELAFGAAAATGLNDDRVYLLTIPDGITGQRPRPDQRFRSDTLHRALYMQLLPHMAGRYDVLIDLHTGLDRKGPSADLICSEPDRLAGLPEGMAGSARLVRLGPGRNEDEAAVTVAETVIPREIWRNPRFLYLGIEVFLPEPGAGTVAQQDYARHLISASLDCLEASLAG